MFRKKIMILMLIVLSFLFTACNKINMDNSSMIKSPKNNKIPVQGAWKVIDYVKLKNSSLEEEELKSWIGNIFQFFEDEMIIRTEFYRNPDYKVKYVNAKQYFFYEYDLDSEVLGIKSKDVPVITITYQDKLIYDLVINNEELFMTVNNVLLRLEFLSKDKLKDNTENFSINNFNKEKIDYDSNIKLKSGVLLGLRYTESSKNKITEEEFEEIKYRTLWIESGSDYKLPIVQCNYLLVPRINGFWKVGVTRLNKEGRISDTLYTKSINRRDTNNKKITSSVNKNPQIISFVGNDYLITEYSVKSEINNISYSQLQVLPIDSINKVRGIKLQDISGAEGITSMISSAKVFLNSLNNEKDMDIETIPKEENFFLVRRNGHWILNGRLYSKTSHNDKTFKNYDISMIPPKGLVNYDDLKVSWNNIKERNPDAVDAYTSPNEDIALVVTKESIYVYSINNGKLSEKYTKKIKLKSNEVIVMSEWATSESFVKAWRNTIITNNGIELLE